MTAEELRRWKVRYNNHMFDARYRGVPWRFTFEQWMGIWIASGNMHERGPRLGQYVMARFGDKGAYRVGNVEIIPASDNNRAAQLGRLRPDLAARNKSQQQRQAICASWKTRAPRTGWKHSEATKAKMKVSAALSWKRGDRKIRADPT